MDFKLLGTDRADIHVGQGPAEALQRGLNAAGRRGQGIHFAVDDRRRFAGTDHAVAIDVEAQRDRAGNGRLAVVRPLLRLVGGRNRQFLHLVAAVFQREIAELAGNRVGGKLGGNRQPLHLVGEVASVNVRIGPRPAGHRIDHRLAAIRIDHLVETRPDNDKITVVVHRQRLAGNHLLLVFADHLVHENVGPVGRRDAQKLPLFQRIDEQAAALAVLGIMTRWTSDALPKALELRSDAVQRGQSENRHSLSFLKTGYQSPRATRAAVAIPLPGLPKAIGEPRSDRCQFGCFPRRRRSLPREGWMVSAARPRAAGGWLAANKMNPDWSRLRGPPACQDSKSSVGERPAETRRHRVLRSRK